MMDARMEAITEISAHTNASNTEGRERRLTVAEGGRDSAKTLRRMEENPLILGIKR